MDQIDNAIAELQQEIARMKAKQEVLDGDDKLSGTVLKDLAWEITLVTVAVKRYT